MMKLKLKYLLVTVALFCSSLSVFAQDPRIIRLERESMAFYDKMRWYDAHDDSCAKLIIDDWDITIADLIVELERLHNTLQELYQSDGGFEAKLGKLNIPVHISVKWRLLKVKMLEHECMLYPGDMDLRQLLYEYRNDFEDWYKDAYLAD